MEIPDFDLVLKSIGEYGRFQKFVFFLLCLASLMSAIVVLSFAFTIITPPFRCHVPNCDTNTKSVQYADAFHGVEFSKFAYPRSEYDCVVYKNDSSNCDVSSFRHKTRIDCTRWIYDQTLFVKTITTEFDLVCQNAWRAPLIASLYFAGHLVGAIPMGQIADIFGRKPVFYFSSLIVATMGLAQTFAEDYTTLAVLVFLQALFQSGSFQIAFVFSVEMVGPTKRAFISIGIEIFFVLGEAILALIAWYFNDWRSIILCSSLPCFLILFYWPFMPESPRWLLTKNRINEAQKIIKLMATWNGTKAPKLEDCLTEVQAVEKRENIFAFCSSKTLFYRQIVVCAGWFMISMSYYGLSFNASALSGSVHINFLLLALVEVPGYLTSFMLMDRVGRRKTTVGSLMLAGIFLLISIPVKVNWIRITLFLMGKLGISCAFSTIYLYTTELLPTTIRTVGLCIASMMAKVGAFISPYIATSSSWGGPHLPAIIFGIGAILIGILQSTLPETSGQELLSH